tara:strand:- start:45655 stop:45999 length:345 start_codon:yes stop_codon:yes gene_type:complete
MTAVKILDGDFRAKSGTFSDGYFVLAGESIPVSAFASFAVEPTTPKQLGGWGMMSEFNPMGLIAILTARIFNRQKRRKLEMTFVAKAQDGRVLRGTTDGQTIGDIHDAFEAAAM